MFTKNVIGVSVSLFVLLTSGLINGEYQDQDGNALNMEDEDSQLRILRNSPMVQFSDDLEEPAEMIPDAEYRQIRGANGLRGARNVESSLEKLAEELLMEAADEDELYKRNNVVDASMAEFETKGNTKEQDIANYENLNSADEEVQDEKRDNNEFDASAGKCKDNQEKCENNADCCSGYCSWTRGSICYTL